MDLDLFRGMEPAYEALELGPGVSLLRGFALREESEVLDSLKGIIEAAPFRHMVTPGGFRMSVAMTSCGSLGWVTDKSGYRYVHADPESGNAWPAMPDSFFRLAVDAAAEARFPAFRPDACLVNRYEPRSKMSLHQDKDENDFSQPIVSVSLGLPAVFQFGGLKRSDKPVRIHLNHGDVIVWGGPARLRYHGVMALKDGSHPALGNCRINLTFRKAG